MLNQKPEIMKTLSKIFFLIAVISLVAGCSKINDLISDELSGQPIKVTVPFEANLLGEITTLDSENPECIDKGYAYHVIVEASGTATYMGKVSLTFDFCTLGPDDPDIPGADNKYAGSSSVLVAANGDKLFLYTEGGSVIDGRTDDQPDYVVAYWRDTFTITGGTGKFEGASGKLQMDDFSTNIDTYSHHHWYGKITLVKGKR
jgi:hypothetical protein